MQQSYLPVFRMDGNTSLVVLGEHFYPHSPAVTIVFSAEPLLSVWNHCFLSKGGSHATSFGCHGLRM